MTDKEIKEALEICKKATPGVWINHFYDDLDEKGTLRVRGPNILSEGCVGDPCFVNEHDAEFIAASREGWPEALKEVKKLKKEIKRLNDNIFDLCLYDELD